MTTQTLTTIPSSVNFNPYNSELYRVTQQNLTHKREMKQSSIDWLYNNLKSHFEHDGDLLDAVKISFEQAKAMHEEEVMEAHYADRYGCFSKDYYNETFNTKEK